MKIQNYYQKLQIPEIWNSYMISKKKQKLANGETWLMINILSKNLQNFWIKKDTISFTTSQKIILEKLKRYKLSLKTFK